MQRILVIDDDPALVDLLAESLHREGFSVSSAASGEMGLELTAIESFQMVLLDVTLPGINGFETLRRLRSRSNVPVVMLTARGEDLDRIVGLEIGADDYLPKPFHFRELVARMNAVLRRTSPSYANAPRGAQSGIQIEVHSRLVRRDGQVLDLTTSEYDLLRVLMESAGNTVPREDLCQQVLGREFNPLDRGIDNLISSLRRKLGPTDEGLERIKTVRNLGYLYTGPAPDPAEL
jgi:two-component system, OmpR family, response regulator CpxR